MDAPEGSSSTFLKADEVDGTAPTISNAAADVRAPNDSIAFDAPDQHVVNQNASTQQGGRPIGDRPPLQRNKSAPRREDAPETNTQSVQDVDASTDSLSLGQLKRLVAEMPRVEPTPYAFEYEDCTSFEEDVEELLGYTVEERASLLRAQRTFYKEWSQCNASGLEEHSDVDGAGQTDWIQASRSQQLEFIELTVERLARRSEKDLPIALECLLYLVLGCWHETAGLGSSSWKATESKTGNLKNSQARSRQHRQLYKTAGVQVQTMKHNVQLVCEKVDLALLFDVHQHLLRSETNSRSEKKVDDSILQPPPVGFSEDRRHSLWAILMILYLVVDLARREDFFYNGLTLRHRLLKIQPSPLDRLTDTLASLRWDDRSNFPISKLILLYWKTILLSFGGTFEVKKLKNILAYGASDGSEIYSEPQITASPLDYHLFRQEITSKYPAFDPPPALFPFEPDSSSMLPPLQDWAAKTHHHTSSAGPANIHGQAASIIHQPVHIATPAPSPPPSPAGPGGKGIKKQNYQTNQMFPFLYPPLEKSSNDLGGKGSTELQDLLVGRKWDGSDIPTSILEAADLFASRMRATRAMKQLWKERVRFMKYERGYDYTDFLNSVDDSAEKTKKEEEGEEELKDLNDETRQIFRDIEAFYQHALPNLQSIVIVLLKVLLQTVTIYVTQSSMSNGFQNGVGSSDHSMHANTSIGQTEDGVPDPSLQELDVLRNQEIMGKAVSAILLLLLKWFKMSHILKFEYFTQLLLDSNYIQLTLKLFAHQELERVVNFKCEHKDLNFFNFCEAHSRNGVSKTSAPSHEDEAVRPPIKQNRELSVGEHGELAEEIDRTPPPPEVDELGFPVSEVPETPITNFSWRAFFSSINYLRVLQKVVKSKPHRQILMAQCKYSNILKRALKVPQSDIRLYTLKVIKGQIPYCHRKWRQGNMRVITAIYLHCRPNLRDEWLMGLDAEQEMGEALPAEQALRSLTYWYNLRRYPDRIGPIDKSGTGKRMDGKGLLEEDQDFFLRELEKMEVALDARGGSDSPAMFEDEEFLQQPGGGLISDVGMLGPQPVGGGVVGGGNESGAPQMASSSQRMTNWT